MEKGKDGEKGEGGQGGTAHAGSPGPHRRHGPAAAPRLPRPAPRAARREGRPRGAAMAPPPSALCLFDVDGTLTAPRQASAGRGCGPAGSGACGTPRGPAVP